MQAGMQEMSDVFKGMGAEIYHEHAALQQPS